MFKQLRQSINREVRGPGGMLRHYEDIFLEAARYPRRELWSLLLASVIAESIAFICDHFGRSPHSILAGKILYGVAVGFCCGVVVRLGRYHYDRLKLTIFYQERQKILNEKRKVS